MSTRIHFATQLSRGSIIAACPSKNAVVHMLQRSWKFGTLRQGTWLCNESGSVHKSFTATSGTGCVLVTLWSGSHADVVDEEFPVEPNVQQAVDKMDQKLTTCKCASDWTRLEETFLPASERSSAAASDS